jgi:hypothetical protein
MKYSPRDDPFGQESVTTLRHELAILRSDVVRAQQRAEAAEAAAARARQSAQESWALLKTLRAIETRYAPRRD